MIDLFTVFTRGGAVLWSYKPHPVKGAPVKSLVNNIFLEEKKAEDGYKVDQYLLKWIFDNEFDLVFVAVYLNLTQLLYIDDLLEAVKREFVATFHNDIRFCRPPSNFVRFDERFLALVKEQEALHLQARAAAPSKKPRTFAESKKVR